VGSSSAAAIIGIGAAALVVIAAVLAFVRPGLVGLGEDEVAEYELLPLETARAETTDTAVTRTLYALRRRAVALGIEADVGLEGERLIVGLPEGSDTDASLARLTPVGAFGLYDARATHRDPQGSLLEAIDLAGPALGVSGSFFLFDRDDGLVAGPTFGRAALDRLSAARYPTGVPNGFTARSVRPGRRVVEDPLPGSGVAYRVLDEPPLVGAGALVSATPRDELIEVRLDPAAARSASRARGPLLAMVDDFALGVARPRGQDLEIAAGDGREEARALAAALQHGPLPLQLALVGRR
jgi:hypothetical protein